MGGNASNRIRTGKIKTLAVLLSGAMVLGGCAKKTEKKSFEGYRVTLIKPRGLVPFNEVRIHFDNGDFIYGVDSDLDGQLDRVTAIFYPPNKPPFNFDYVQSKYDLFEQRDLVKK